MKLSLGDALLAALQSLRGFRWPEYQPFAWIAAIQIAFLALCTQLDRAWAMGAVASLARLVNGEGNIHYPMFFAYVSILLGWVESFAYTVPGALLIPLSLLRLYARNDRALSLGAGARDRLIGAMFPTLVAGLLLIGAAWNWQRHAARPIRTWIAGFAPAPLGDNFGWLVVTLGGYAIYALLLYVPVAAVQARTNPVRAFGLGVRFGLRAWVPTFVFSAFFGSVSMLIQYVLERHGAFLLTRLRPETILVFLGLYAIVTSLSSYITYGAAARLYRMARGDE